MAIKKIGFLSTKAATGKMMARATNNACPSDLSKELTSADNNPKIKEMASQLIEEDLTKLNS